MVFEIADWTNKQTYSHTGKIAVIRVGDAMVWLQLIENDEVPCNVKQLGTAKINFNNQQQQHSATQVDY